jgi:hypothetical protein
MSKKKAKRSPIQRAIEQLIMEDCEVYMNRGIATLMNGAVGVDLEANLLFADNPKHFELIVHGTSKAEIVEKIKALMKQVELLRERAAANLEGNRVD